MDDPNFMGHGVDIDDNVLNDELLCMGIEYLFDTAK
jgi:hypothetical protein